MTRPQFGRICFQAALLCGVWQLSTRATLAALPAPISKPVSLFDGTLAQWEGDPKIWRVEDGVIKGGSLTETIAQNDFLCTKRDFTNFVLRLKLKLTGPSGVINTGVQICTSRIPTSHESSGYEWDYGVPYCGGPRYET